MASTDFGASGFDERFVTQRQAKRYRDRYKTGRRVRTDLREKAALREVLENVGSISVALDLPCGSGRLGPVLATVAAKVILADSSTAMLTFAREECPPTAFDHLHTDARHIELPDRSVDLVFSHRFLHHLDEADTRAQVLAELVRVTRRYVILSFFPPGIRSRFTRWVRRVLGRIQPGDPLATETKFLDEASAGGLRLVQRKMLRRFPLRAAFYLFERA
jgi:ubiquinone/menaquinone biosynthesis C-methylase UbiE